MASKKQTKKIGAVMREYKTGTLHSGKKGPVVKDIKQAIDLGAAGVSVGTVFIASNEAGVSQDYKQAMVDAKKEYKKDWDADYKSGKGGEGKRVKTKKSAATKAYQRMFGDK